MHPGEHAYNSGMADHIYRLKNGFVNLYLIDEPDGLTLIDTGIARSGPKLVLQKISELGRQPGDLKRILITHADPDHTGGAAELKAKTGATVYASAIEKPAIERGGTSRNVAGNAIVKAIFGVMGKLMPTPPVPVDQISVGGQTLPILGGLNVLATPGHTPGHLSFYIPSQHTLIAGDAWNAMTGTLAFKPAPVHWDYTVGRESVKLLEQVGAKTIWCGHGGVITQP